MPEVLEFKKEHVSESVDALCQLNFAYAASAVRENRMHVFGTDLNPAVVDGFNVDNVNAVDK